ncbi:MAG: hypothetical protein QG637_701, partial [Chloroflexota bacterium]|nr:hypothetical protein [Chloroflexota bacterium]
DLSQASWAATDTDLRALHPDPRFSALLNQPPPNPSTP